MAKATKPKWRNGRVYVNGHDGAPNFNKTRTAIQATFRDGDPLAIVPWGMSKYFSITHINTGLDCRAKFRTITGAKKAVDRIIAEYPDIGDWTTETFDGWSTEYYQGVKNFIMSLEKELN